MQTERVIEYVVDWLARYCDASGLQGFVVGVSGGIDSAVTACLCAATGRRTLLLNLPIHQAADQKARGAEHSASLVKRHPCAEAATFDLTAAFDTLAAALPTEIRDDLTMANTRSRLRMATLYAFAGHHRLLVAGTGNKVEDFGVGFFTKYGDGGVDIAPLADLMKSEVYALGRALGVSAAILAAPPTDGLWDDQRTDEKQIGATYAELEWAMRQGGQAADENLTSRQREVLAIYRRFHTANRHKMEPIPVVRIPDALR